VNFLTKTKTKKGVVTLKIISISIFLIISGMLVVISTEKLSKQGSKKGFKLVSTKKEQKRREFTVLILN